MPDILHGKSTKVWAAGHRLTRYLNSADLSIDTEALDTTTFDPPGGAKTYIVGQGDGTMGFQGLWDDADGASDDIVQNLGDDSPVIATVVLDGVGFTGQAIATAITRTAPAMDVVRLSLDLQLARQADGQLKPLLVGTEVFEGVLGAAAGQGPIVDIGAHTGDLLIVLHVDAVAAGGSLQLHTSTAANFGSSSLIFTAGVAAIGQAASITFDVSDISRYTRLEWTGQDAGNRVLAVVSKV